MFKNLKSLFVTVDEPENNQDTQPDKNSTPEITGSEKSDNKVPGQSTSPVIDNTIIDKLLKALENNNQPGFDYFEYKRSLKSLEKLPMDEATKYQSAFATAATMEVTLDKLLASIDFYKKVLQQEEVNFSKTSKEQYLTNVENKKGDIEKIANLIKEKSQKIQMLTEEIREHQKSQEQLSQFISTADAKIKATEMNFKAALNELLMQMDNDIEKLKQFVK